nr:MAG TPA: hypothetical protein [Caudoviricetes sp.]
MAAAGRIGLTAYHKTVSVSTGIFARERIAQRYVSVNGNICVGVEHLWEYLQRCVA